jgi:hypothetical protein
MRKLFIALAAASIFAAASARTATAQVTGIRHTDGSWTYVDANGRDIHTDYYAGRTTHHRARHDVANERSRTAGHDSKGYKATGYLPWQSR